MELDELIFLSASINYAMLKRRGVWDREKEMRDAVQEAHRLWELVGEERNRKDQEWVDRVLAREWVDKVLKVENS